MIRESLNDWAQSQNRVWAHDRAKTVGASEIGQCARKVFWLKNEGDGNLAAPRDDGYVDTWGARFRGSVYEDQFWYPALRATYGRRLRFAGRRQTTFVSGFLSATPDGMITGLAPDEIAPGSGREVMVECKTVDPRSNLTEAKPENVYQTQVQMGIVREQTEFKPTHSILSYTNASFWDEVTEFVIPFDPKIYAAAKARATKIMTAMRADELKPEGWIAGGRECDHCPFTKACGIQRRALPEGDAKPDPQFAAEITDLARAAKRLESMRDDADERLRAAQQDIRDRLREKGVRKVPGVVSWSSIKGRQSYDNKSIREAAIDAGIDINQFSLVGEATDRLTISVKGLTEFTQAVA